MFVITFEYHFDGKRGVLFVKMNRMSMYVLLLGLSFLLLSGIATANVSRDPIIDEWERQFLNGELRDIEALWTLASLYLLVGDTNMSMKAATTAFEMEEPKTSLTYRRMGILLFQTDQYDASLTYLRHAASLSPDDYWARYHIVLALDYLINRNGELRLLPEYEQTILELQALESKGVKLPSLAYFYIGRYYADRGQIANARYYYGEFVKLHDPTTQEEARYMINAINYLKAYE